MSQSDFEAWLKADIQPSDSVGILAYECESYIVLLQSIGENQVADGIKISRSAIREIREIGEMPLTLELSQS
jgi:hypothetical protein